ncbi:MAG: hypothetical protein HQK92_10175 [Nitrospirae bacterium]|nr:hypothetical protein [Nitrospirota bacterium]
MHLEILVEDQSGKKMLEILVPKIIDPKNTFRVISYKGSGRIPENLKSTSDPKKRILLERLPKLIRGYGNTFKDYPKGYSAAVIMVCDLDKRTLSDFLKELLEVLDHCNPKPETRFCIAIEEGEAWLLGDLNAVRLAYPNAKDDVLNSYINDSICGTWEKLADAVYPGGHEKLKPLGFQTVGAEKSKWAENISPYVDVEKIKSKSFGFFRKKIMELV